jgi:glycosyltransferase involved in cell wall biosynthesis
VIICTRNRGDSLARCLSSIAADPSTTPAEILVIDNGSSDNTGTVIRAAARDSFRPMRTVWIPAPGKTRALNQTIPLTHGLILVFADDDVQVQPGWLDALVAPFDDPAVAATGGRVIPTFLCERPDWLADDGIFGPLILEDYGIEAFRFEQATRLPFGANMAIRASVLDANPFDTRLGHNTKVSMGYEETFLLAGLVSDHYVLYVPDAVVRHLLGESILTPVAAQRKLFHSGFGAARYHRLRGEPARSLPLQAIETARAWRRAFRAHATVADRVNDWFWAGYQAEALVGPRSIPLANWCATHLGPRAR